MVAAFITLVLIAFANAQPQDLPLNITAPIAITPVDFLKSHFLQPNYVNGVKDCGGLGRTLQFTHNNCLPALPAVPCIADIDKISMATMYFVAAEDASDVIVRPTVTTSDGITKSFDFHIPGLHLKAGQSYAAHAVGNPQPELLGKLFTARVEIIRGSDKSVQACSQVDFIVYKE